MGDDLTQDEFDALQQILAGQRQVRPSACVARNTRRLAGLKYIAYAKDGSLGLTDKGKQTLFIKSCIDGLRAIAGNSATAIKNDVTVFLSKKGHISAREPEGFEVTQKGRECLADMDSRSQ